MGSAALCLGLRRTIRDEDVLGTQRLLNLEVLFTLW